MKIDQTKLFCLESFRTFFLSLFKEFVVPKDKNNRQFWLRWNLKQNKRNHWNSKLLCLNEFHSQFYGSGKLCLPNHVVRGTEQKHINWSLFGFLRRPFFWLFQGCLTRNHRFWEHFWKALVQKWSKNIWFRARHPLKSQKNIAR